MSHPLIDNDAKLALDPAFVEYLEVCHKRGISDLAGFVLRAPVDVKSVADGKTRVSLTDTTPFRLYKHVIHLMKKAQCPGCWTASRLCMCKRIQHVKLRHRVFLFMHRSGSNFLAVV